MALDRQSIERKDFPIGRRGYDPEAVDAHLSTLADEIDELKRSARKRNESLAAAASEQVRAIVEVAETSAAQIQRQAEEQAREIRDEASSEAAQTREQATTQARDYVGQVSESTQTMLQRLDAMEGELGSLFESLRTGSNRLNADLQLLERNLEEVRDAVSPRPRFEPEPEPAQSRSGGASEAPAPAPSQAAPEAREDRGGAIREEPQPPEEGSGKVHGDTLAEATPANGSPPVSEPGDGPDEAEDARLIALNMALNGAPREETERYLAENFRLHDRRGLLDEVYASVDG